MKIIKPDRPFQIQYTSVSTNTLCSFILYKALILSVLYRSIALLGLFFVIAAVTTGSLSAQTAAPDTLQMVKVLQEQGQFRDADPLIQQYYRDHSNDLYAAWMYGHNLHQLGKYHQAEEVYDIALEQHPDQLDMAFEYASKLIGRGRTSRAISVLRAYLEKQARYTPAMVSMAQCLYWEGQHDDAMAWIRKIYTEEPDHQAARELEKAIRNDHAPWLSLGADLRRDDQPLKTVTWKFLAGIPVSPGLTLLTEADLPTFPDARIDPKGHPGCATGVEQGGRRS